jgi:tRNA-(ms[2]io[6]A)-hydroxylase
MYGLKLPTDPRWVNLAKKQLEEILNDHAYCELKAASTGISLIHSYPELSRLVKAITPVVSEDRGTTVWYLTNWRNEDFRWRKAEKRICEQA